MCCFFYSYSESINFYFQLLLETEKKKVFLLFIFGTESCVFSKLCKWWRWGGGGKLRRRCCVSSFSNCYFSDKMNQNRLIQYKNSYFLLSIFKNRLKWIKNPSLHDSLIIYMLCKKVVAPFPHQWKYWRHHKFYKLPFFMNFASI